MSPASSSRSVMLSRPYAYVLAYMICMNASTGSECMACQTEPSMCVRHTAEDRHVYMACSQMPCRIDSLLSAVAGWSVEHVKQFLSLLCGSRGCFWNSEQILLYVHVCRDADSQPCTML